MFLEQVVQNATTSSITLQKLSNLRIEFEKIKENLSKNHDHLQTYTLELETVESILEKCDKELITSKGQLNKVQHENQNMSNELIEAEQATRKTKNLQQEYAKLNQLNWKTHNDFICLQVELEWTTRDYAKMEESNLEQQRTIIDLERTYQDFRE